MLIADLNKLFASNEINKLLLNIAKSQDHRMCLNSDVIKTFKNFFADIILLSFVIDIKPNELEEIYKDKENYLTKKLETKLNVSNIYKHKDKVEKYFNRILGKKRYIFHGTNSSMEKYFTKDLDKTHVNIEECKAIDAIYRKHGIYLAFQSGIRDYNNNNFFVTTCPNSATFYSLQSPEYFARFASRSDYYKNDIYKYDRIAYYRKDFKACYKNIKKEIQEFSFNTKEKTNVIKNFKKMWNNIVFEDMKSIIFFNEVEYDNNQRIDENQNLFESLLKYFTKVHFVYDFNKFKNDINEIVLPDIKRHLRRQNPVFNQKFVVFNNKKYKPDFYVDCKYSKKKIYYTLNAKQDFLVTIAKNVKDNDKATLINLVNEARPNTLRARRFLKQAGLPTVSDVIAYFKTQFKTLVKELENAKELTEKANIIKEISDNIGLKYIVSLKYNQFFKDINQYCIYQYRKYLGIKLFEHYEGLPTITSEKIQRLILLYKNILKSEKFILNYDIPYKIFSGEIEVVK